MTRDGHDGDRAALHEAMSASGRSVKTAAAEKRRIDMLRRHEREVSAGNMLRLTKWGSSSKQAPPEKGADADAMLKVIAPYDEPSGSTSEVALFAWLNSHVGVIHPLGAFRIRWDVVTSVVLFACLLVTPYQLCFIRADLRPMDRMELLNLAFDVVFLADFFLNFNTGYVDDHGTVVKDHRRIVKQYARGWAAVDLVSSIPVNHLLALANSGLHLGATRWRLKQSVAPALSASRRAPSHVAPARVTVPRSRAWHHCCVVGRDRVGAFALRVLWGRGQGL